MESIEKPIIMLELNRWEYHYFCLNSQKNKNKIKNQKKPNANLT